MKSNLLFLRLRGPTMTFISNNEMKQQRLEKASFLGRD